MKVAVVGAGYVGLVTSACLAAQGHTVSCVDLVADRVDMINRGEVPFHEEGLQSILSSEVRAGRLTATTSLSDAHRGSDVTFVTVGTPTVNGAVNFRPLDAAAIDIGRLLGRNESYHTVVVKSTVPPTTTDTRVRGILERESGKKAGEFGLVMNPEFLREGCAVHDFLHPDRIVIGAFDDRAFESVRALYARTEDRIVRTTPRTAELIKYATNSLLGTMISFANELATICEAVPDVDIVDVMQGLHLDRRLTITQGDGTAEIASYLKAGCGFGGSCLPKDIAALVGFGQSLGLDMAILNGTLSVNARRRVHVVELAAQALGSLHGRAIAVLGTAFKPNTDDIRESPAVGIIKGLLVRGAEVRAHDPVARLVDTPVSRHPCFTGVRGIDDALRGADAAIVVTPWPEYLAMTPQSFKALMKTPILIDTRRAFSRTAMIEGGMQYYGAGLASIVPVSV